MVRENSLVLYKGRPARVQRAGEKLDLELERGETAHVRSKDVTLLHPGPLSSLAALEAPLQGEVQAAWEILAGSTTTLPELAELAYGSYTPLTAWAAWQLVAEGLYFRGSVDAIAAATPEEVVARQAARDAGDAERRAWSAFLGRARQKTAAPEDERFLKEVEGLAFGQLARSRVLRELGIEETPENAHALLLDLGRWTAEVNPYPRRLGLPDSAPVLDLPDLPAEDRLDLTHLVALAIDDAYTDTPDDALSLAGDRLWVHVADPAALVVPDGALDLEARERGATSYLPERTIPMLPAAAIPRLGLGLTEVSPALSFGIDFDAQGRITGLEIAASWIRATRLTYEEAEQALDQEPLAGLLRLAQRYAERRAASGAINIDLPEVDIAVEAGVVSVRPVLPLRSRLTVQEAMIAAGEAAAQYALAHDIPIAYATQEAPDAAELPAEAATMADMFALRRTLKRRQYRAVPGGHAGLGLPAYVQATSPLRRYLDLVAHQQLRAYVRGQPVLDQQALLERVGATEAVNGSVRQAESLSNRHWTMVYLLQHPGWRGEGVLVDRHGMSGTVLVPALDLEARVHLPADLPLDTILQVVFRDVDLAHLDPRFRVTA